MNQALILIAVFLSLFLSMFYLSHLILSGSSRRSKISLRAYPKVSIAIPAYNEEASLRKTVESVLALNYPRDRLEVIIINDGSIDGTDKVADNLAKEHGVLVIHQENAGKAAALNAAIGYASGGFFGCVDADSTVDRDALVFIMERFEKEDASAVISSIKVADPVSTLQHLQRFEYLVSVLMRSLYSSLDFLSVTPGVLSVYRKEAIVEIGGFDTHTLTEDFEIAMRLKAYGKRILLSAESITYTNVPLTVRELRAQRVRWYRGFITTMLKHRSIVMSRRHSTFGLFYLPTTLISILFIFLLFPYMVVNVVVQIVEFFVRSSIVDSYVFLLLRGEFSLTTFLLSQNYYLVVPIGISLGFGVYLIHRAYRFMQEPMDRPVSLFAYLFLFPIFMYVFWTISLYEELMRVRKRW